MRPTRACRSKQRPARATQCLPQTTGTPGLTLIEMVIVLMVIAILAGLLVPMIGRSTEHTKLTATQTTLVRLHEVIAGRPDRPGYVADMRKLPWPEATLGVRANHPQLAFLFLNPRTSGETAVNDFVPRTGLGWRGPYLMQPTGTYQINPASGFDSRFGNANDPTATDGWGNPIVISADDGLANLTDAELSPAGVLVFRLISAGPDGALVTVADNLHLEIHRQQEP